MKAMFVSIAVLGSIAALSLFLVTPIDDPAMGIIQQLWSPYESLAHALSQDDLAAARKVARQLSEKAEAVKDERIASNAFDLETSDSLFAARQEFKAISAAMAELLRGRPGYYIFTCQMPAPGCLMKDCDWVQSNPTIANPYLGQAMPNCGVLKE